MDTFKILYENCQVIEHLARCKLSFYIRDMEEPGQPRLFRIQERASSNLAIPTKNQTKELVYERLY